MTARLVGADGSLSDPVAATVRVGAGGAPAPRVERVRWRGRAGELVVRGDGFDAPGLTVLLDGAPVPVAQVSPTELVVHAAGLVDPAEVEVRTERGTGRARGPVTPRVEVEILPDDAVLSEGETLQLTALVHGSRDGGVDVDARGRAGGRRPDGDGALTAAHGAPEKVHVRAASVADPSATATAGVRVIAPAGDGGVRREPRRHRRVGGRPGDPHRARRRPGGARRHRRAPPPHARHDAGASWWRRRSG